jgi:hypothetical protein
MGEDPAIIRLNIERYQRLLQMETDETVRQRITAMLAEEEAKLERFVWPERERHLC